MFKTNLAPLTL